MGFWQGKKVLVTGHTGFKGSWLSLWLIQRGAQVMGYALEPDTEPSLFKLLNLENEMTSIIGDVQDAAKLSSVINHHQPEIILHLAAQPLVRYSYQHPLETYQTNVMGTANILNTARHCASVRVVLNVTTDKCYENDDRKEAYKECDKLGGYDPYSSSKACSELVTSAFRDSYFTDADKAAIASARAGNVIGGGDWSQDRLIPDCIMNFIDQKPVEIRYPDAVRPWQHVLESLSGYLLLAEKLYQEKEHFVGAWNFGPTTQEVATVGNVVDYLVRNWGGAAEWTCPTDSQPHEANFLMIDSTKAHKKLQWQPRWNVYQALDKVIEWYQAWNSGADIKELTLQQIKHYEDNKQ